MGTTLLAVKQSFVASMNSLQPTAASQFVVWLDEKVAEYKVNGSMNLQLKKDTPSWIKEYNMAILLNDDESPMDHSNALIPHSIERLNQVKESRKRLIRSTDAFAPPVKVRKRITDKMIAEFSHYANYASQLTQSQIASGLNSHSLLSSASPSMVPNISAYSRVSGTDVVDKRRDVRNVENKDGQSTDLSSEGKAEDRYGVDESGDGSYTAEYKETSPTCENELGADIAASSAGSTNQQKEASRHDQTSEAESTAVVNVTQSLSSKMIEELAQFGFPSPLSQNQGAGLDSTALMPAPSVLPNMSSSSSYGGVSSVNIRDAVKDDRPSDNVSASMDRQEGTHESDDGSHAADVNNFGPNRVQELNARNEASFDIGDINPQDMLEMGTMRIKTENPADTPASDREHPDAMGMMHFNPEQTSALGAQTIKSEHTHALGSLPVDPNDAGATVHVNPEAPDDVGVDGDTSDDDDDGDIGPNFFEEPDDAHTNVGNVSTAVAVSSVMPMSQPPVIPLFTRPIKFRAAMRKPIRRKMLEGDLPLTEAMVLSDPDGASTSDYRAPAMPTPMGMIDGLCTGNVVTCSYCCKAFKSLNSLRDHVRCIHVLMPQYACPQCGKSFRWRSSYWRHTKSCTYNYSNTLPEQS